MAVVAAGSCGREGVKRGAETSALCSRKPQQPTLPGGAFAQWMPRSEAQSSREEQAASRRQAKTSLTPRLPGISGSSSLSREPGDGAPASPGQPCATGPRGPMSVGVPGGSLALRFLHRAMPSAFWRDLGLRDSSTLTVVSGMRHEPPECRPAWVRWCGRGGVSPVLR